MTDVYQELIDDKTWLISKKHRKEALLAWHDTQAQKEIIERIKLADKTSADSASPLMSDITKEFSDRELIQKQKSEGKKDFYKWTTKGKVVVELVKADLYSKTHKRLREELNLLEVVLP